MSLKHNYIFIRDELTEALNEYGYVDIFPYSEMENTKENEEYLVKELEKKRNATSSN